MKSLVIFDSIFGNTKIIAETIAKSLGKGTKAVSVSDFNSDDINGVSLLVVGSPIIGWKPSEKMGKFLDSLNKDELKNIKAATFDTRINIFIHGDAKNKIAGKLKQAGAEIIGSEFFFVKDKEGPLVEGQIEKAKKWVSDMISL